MTKEPDVGEDSSQEALRSVSPALWAALSPLARPLRLPANFLPQQTAEARGKTFNATIGQITDGKGKAVPLGPMAEALGGLTEELRNRALLYSPVEGFADLIEFVCDAIFGQHVLNLEPGCAEQVAEGVLVFLPVHAPDDGAAGSGEPGAVGGNQRR